MRRATRPAKPDRSAPDNFYPRSPCGERLLPRCRRWKRRRFLSTLSLRRATCSTGTRATSRATFLSTLSLRRATASKALCATAFFLFLSTLSLRRATGVYYGGRPQHSIDFYPRSPCGERLFRVAVFQHTVVISIHALLAESDPGAKSRTPERYYFYPRSPCGERPYGRINDISRLIFLSTLSLRRATSILDYFSAVMRHFYPRSPCGERHILSILIIGFLEFLSTLSLRRATVQCQLPG